MRKIRNTFFTLAVLLTLSACGVFGDGSDGTDVAVAEDVAAQPTVNSVQAVPAQTPTPVGQAAGAAEPAAAALPTAVTLPTAAPTPEPTVDRSQPTTYVVQSGDVLGLIAERFDADIQELRRVNNLDGNLIRVGQELTIPAEVPASGSTDTTDSASGNAAAPAPAAPAAPSAPVSCGSAATGHCVQPGESLLGIALKYDVSVEALRAANPGVSGDLIRSGQVLNLPGAGSTSAAPAATTADPGPAVAAAPADAAPAPTVGPVNDADCAARNPEFPFFHAADGLCYANPIGGTPIPTIAASNVNDVDNADETTCDPGFFLWEDGLCYPIPGVTAVVPTAEATATPDGGGVISGGSSGQVAEDYGRPPCRDGYVVLVTTNQCWPEATNLEPTTVTPVPSQ